MTVKDLQSELGYITEWSDASSTWVNPDKAILMWFSQNNRNGDIIERTLSTQQLILKSDEGFGFTKHINHTASCFHKPCKEWTHIYI